MTDMKPCPFCGSKNLKELKSYIGPDDYFYHYGCLNCRADGPCEQEYPWNTRPLEDALEADNQRLLDAMEEALSSLNIADVYDQHIIHASHMLEGALRTKPQEASDD